MKQEVLFCLLLTISAGTCHGHGVKGSYSNSYSSSSASSSASSFSSSYSSGGPVDPNILNDVYKNGNGAFSAAAAHADANGASANAGAGAYSGSFSTSGAQAGHAVHLSSGGQGGVLASAGSFSGSGSYSGSSQGCTTGCGSNSDKNLLIDINGDGNSGEKITISGIQPTIPDLDLNEKGSASNSGSIQPQIPGTIPVIVTAPQNKHSGPGPAESKPQGTYFINDFRVPDEYIPNGGSGGSTFDLSKGGSVINLNAGSNAGHDQGTIIKNPYQGHFPGPKGSIHDFKPAPPGGGGPPAWAPEQKPISVQPNHVHTDLTNRVNAGSNGISSDLIHTFPGQPGSIYSSKPASDIKPHIPTSNIPVAVVPVPTISTQPHQTVEDKIIPGNGAFAVIGKLPGPSGSIFTSVSASQGSHNQNGAGFVQVSVQPITGSYNKNPLPSDIINQFPGKPGSIHDSKPVAGSNCAGNQCIYNKQEPQKGPGYIQVPLVPVTETFNKHSVKPDCGTGACDEYGGRLGCHGNDCFGPGKKPSYINSGSISGANANSNANRESGNFNIEFGKPTSNEGPLCTHGNCGGKQDNININCVNGICEKNDNGIRIQLPQPGVISVGIVSDNKPVNFNPPEHVPEVYPTPGSINFDINQRVPEYPGTLCSGLQCILPPVPGSKHVPGNTPTSGCSGAYCISIIPDNQEKLNCQNGKCENRDKPVSNENPNQENRNIYSGSESNANAQSTKNQENINLDLNKQQPTHIDLPIEVEIPVNTEDEKENKLKEPVPSIVPVQDNKPGSSMDFLLPGNKPTQHYHPHINKPNGPDSNGGYYSCTGSSCPLPKHPGQVTPSPTVQHSTTVAYPKQPYQPNNKPNCGNKPCDFPESYPQYSQHQPNCNGKDCTNLEPNTNPICIGGACVYNNQPQIPDAYKGAGGKDRLFVPNYNQELPPIVTPVIVKDQPQDGPQTNFNAGSQANAQANSQNGFVSGSVIVEKPDGLLIPVIDVQPPSINRPGYSCSGTECGSLKPIHGGIINSGSRLGSSDVNFEGSNQGNAYPDYPERNVPGSGCSTGKCGANGGSQGSYSSSSNGLVQGNVHGGGCSTGNCGQGFIGGQFGSYSGSGSFGGVKGGCKTGSCGFQSSGSGSYSGSFSSSSSFGGSGSGSYGGGVKGGPSAGSYSSSGSGAGFENGFPLLKELINQSIKGGHSGSGSFSGSNSYSGSSASSHSSAYSSSGSFYAK
ncbi:uncharacterized protein LOC126881069 [Diabrotica virgifera virgifera]|uniref:Uncharacterized protein LOC114335117 n=1 Tax=Diabrotica virgifera virgifera TaxID=50390 RepID=A0A6P7FX10_DIAVI|nr:uncharacterized protein LOC126881069 [Diabrotica virgifera virgifera]